MNDHQDKLACDKKWIRCGIQFRNLIFTIVFFSILGLIFMHWLIVPKIKVGTVVYKIITTAQSQPPEAILFQTSTKVTAIDETFAYLNAPEEGEFIIDESMETELMKKYSQVKYIVNIGLCDSGVSISYQAPREIYNKMKLGSVVKFGVERKQQDTIKQLIEF